MSDESLLRNLELAQFKFNQGLFAEAEFYALSVPQHAPFFSDAVILAARSCYQLDRVCEAIALLRMLVSMQPDNSDAWFTLGFFLSFGEEFNDAFIAYQSCLRINPDHTDALYNFAELLRVNDHFDASLVLLKKLKPLLKQAQLYDYYHNLAVVFSHLKQSDEAIDAFECSLKASNSGSPVTEWEYSHLLLAINQWERGWKAYDYRFLAGHKTNVACAPFPYPLWQGENLEGNVLLIHGEQGLGDEIMFGQIVPELIEEGATIIWGAQPPLVRLFAQSNPEAFVFAHNVGNTPRDLSDYSIDYQTPIGSIARWKRKTNASFVKKFPSIAADPQCVQWFSERICLKMGQYEANFLGKKKAPIRKKVGIMWGANPAKGLQWGEKRSFKKSIPLELFKPLSLLSDQIQFFSLQNKDAGKEIIHAPELDMIDFHEDLHSMAETAALIENMDLVITVDTSIAHLSGAMHKPTWVLLMEQADWRWHHEGEKSTWYPSVCLLRQSDQGDWRPVIQRLLDDLHTWLTDILD